MLIVIDRLAAWRAPGSSETRGEILAGSGLVLLVAVQPGFCYRASGRRIIELQDA